MAAGSTPTKYDPKAGARGTLGTTLTTTLYTAPAGERGVKVGVILTNKSGGGVAATIDHSNSGATVVNKIFSVYTVPGNGLPVCIEGIQMDAGDLIRGGAASVSAIDYGIYVIELAT